MGQTIDSMTTMDYGISLPSVDQRLMFSVFCWATVAQMGFSLALDCQCVEDRFLCFPAVCLYI